MTTPEPEQPTVPFHAGSTTATLITDPNLIPDLLDEGIGLIGREILQKQLELILHRGQKAVIFGEGGAGKTALASQCIFDWMLETGGSVLHMRAGSIDADALLATLAQPFDPRAAQQSNTPINSVWCASC